MSDLPTKEIKTITDWDIAKNRLKFYESKVRKYAKELKNIMRPKVVLMVERDLITGKRIRVTKVSK